MDINDLLRLAKERLVSQTQTNGEWAIENDIDMSVIDALASFSNHQLVNYLRLYGGDASEAIASMSIDFFMIGWDAANQYGKRADLSGVDQE